jgi:tRNA threonylcarbamoyladenosine biosynthesis protein TsaE
LKRAFKITSNSVNHTLNIGKVIAKYLKKGDIICLFGQLGSGKTQLVKSIAAGLDAKSQEVNSPSFVLLKQYKAKIFLNHFDLYRLKKIKEIFDLGFDEYIYSDNISIIEWAERLKTYKPLEFLGIKLTIIDRNSRQFLFSAKGAHYQELTKNLSSAFKL